MGKGRRLTPWTPKRKNKMEAGRLGPAPSVDTADMELDVNEPKPLPDVPPKSLKRDTQADINAQNGENKENIYPKLDTSDKSTLTLPPRPEQLNATLEQPNAEQDQQATPMSPKISDEEFEKIANILPGNQLSAFEKDDLIHMIMILRGAHIGSRGVMLNAIERLTREKQQLSTDLQEHVEHIGKLNISLGEQANELQELRAKEDKMDITIQTQASQTQQLRMQAEEQLATQRQQIEDRLQAKNSQAMELYNEAQKKFLQADKEKRQISNVLIKMQKADPHKLDDAHFKNSIKDLRWAIRNWSRGQPIPLTQQGSGTMDAMRRLGGGNGKKPMYEFLKNTTPRFEEYTSSPEMFPWLLQAYIWDQLVAYVFDDDLWAGPVQPVNEGEPMDMPILVAKSFDRMRRHLMPENEATKDDREDFHEWRSTTSRILSKTLTPLTITRSILVVRRAILKDFVLSLHPEPIDFDKEELNSIIEKALELATSIAKQRAHFRFKFFDQRTPEKQRFSPETMASPFELGPLDEKKEARCVVLTLAPGLFKYGTSEGRDFEVCSTIMKTDVQTRVLSLKR